MDTTVTDETVDETTAPDPSDSTDLAAVRDLILVAHPDIVPELVTGATIADLTASIEPARAAYERIADQAVSRQPSAVSQPREMPADVAPSASSGQAPRVPSGGAPMVVDLDRLPTAEKLRRGVAHRSR